MGNITTPQYAVLAQLELNPYISNADLARRAFITPQTMHSILLNLEEQGLLERNAHPQNKRILLATLTDQGHVTVQEAHKKIKAVETKMLASLSSEDKKHFEQLLRNCFNAMNND